MNENQATAKPVQPAGQAAPFLELRDVSKTFRPGLWKTFRVLNGISLSLDIHQCTAMLGHNGAGKTSTIRTLLGLIHPDRGEVLCEGRPMTTADRRRLGFMPEVSKLPVVLSS